MTTVLSVCNQKGGVGKTTTSVNLSSALAKNKKKILLVDLDPQGNATMGSGINKNKLSSTIADLLLSEVESLPKFSESDKSCRESDELQQKDTKTFKVSCCG